MIIDTHCHLDFAEFNPDRESVIERAKKAGVSYIVNIGSSMEGSRKSVDLAGKYDNIFATVGVHPHHADEVTDGQFLELEKLAENKKVVGIGEVGLDYFKSPSPADKQKELFVKFIGLSGKLNLPLVIHNRDAHSDTLEVIKKTCGKTIKGVMHCFSGDKMLLKHILDMGLFISFTCNLTFKNARHLRETAKYAPIERLLLETDAPFLAPQAKRGKRNEPAYITELRDILSELLNKSKGDIERITTDNAKSLFGLTRIGRPACRSGRDLHG